MLLSHFYRLLTPLAVIALHRIVTSQGCVQTGLATDMCLATWWIVIAATGKAGEDARRDVASASVAGFAVILRITCFASGQLVDTATMHGAVAGDLVVALIDTLRVIGLSTSHRLGCVLCGNASVRIAALDAVAQDFGVGAIIAAIGIVTKGTTAICRIDGTLRARICGATTFHCLRI